MPLSMEETRVNTPYGRLFVKRWAPAANQRDVPVVLFHDSLGCVELWRDFPEHLALATGREVIAYDRLGFGRSDPYPGALDTDFITREAGAVFPVLSTQLDVSRFIAFGHSVGGAMAAACAAEFPGRCHALITESAQAFVEDRTLAGIRDAERAFMQKGLDGLAKYHGEKAAWVLRAWTGTWLSGVFRDWTLDGVLRSVQCPLLAIHGENDEYGSLRHPERMAALTCGPSAIEMLPNCGHLPHREKQGVVIDAVRAFLGRFSTPA